MKSKNLIGALTGACLSLALALPAHAQTTPSAHPGYDPTASMGEHSHVGELGEKSLILERELKCPCGCGLDLHSCQFQMQCGYSPEWSQRIRESLAAGQDVETIKAGFVADFGNTALMMPPAEGFNLLGYFLPGLAIVAAAALVGIVARGGATRSTLAPVTELSVEDEERLRAELQRLEESESPDW